MQPERGLRGLITACRYRRADINRPMQPGGSTWTTWTLPQRMQACRLRPPIRGPCWSIGMRSMR